MKDQDKIGLRVGWVVNQYKVAEHFELRIGDQTLTFQCKQDAIAQGAALDGIYILRTSMITAQMDFNDCVRHYKSLADVERAFRSIKTPDLRVLLHTIGWPIGCAPTSYCVCWPTMWGGTCGKPGAN